MPTKIINPRFALLSAFAARMVVLLLAFGSSVAIQAATNTYFFTYTNRSAFLADGWSFLATKADGSTRNTETTSGAVVSYDQVGHPGVLRIPADVGDMWSLANDTRNSIFRNLSSNWTSVRLQLAFVPTQNYQQVELAIYQNDDNYIEAGFGFNSFLNVALNREVNGTPVTVNQANLSTTNVILRLDRDSLAGDVTALYSLDGTNWTTVTTASQSLLNPRLAIWVGGSPSNFPSADLSRLDIITSDTNIATAFVAQPQSLVFNSIVGQSCTNLQAVHFIRRGPYPVSWSLTSSAPWLTTDVSSGSLPGACNASVNTAGLAVGTYQATLQVAALGASNNPAPVNVTLIVNPASRAKLSTWQGGKSGAMTLWVDDSNGTGFSTLQSNGFAGTYVMWHTDVPPFYTSYYQAGMELGSHTVDHPCYTIDEPTLRFEIETNVAALIAGTPVTAPQVISFAWPCGVTSTNEEVVAADYFMVSRGYNINTLEDPSPSDFMNLKSFNSHEHDPGPTAPPNPADLKTEVDAAIAQGKWFNMVLHGLLDDDGAISYANGMDIWFAPAGTVTKYIQQRDRTVITNYVESSGKIQFGCYRLPIPASSLRSFETAINTNDFLTFQVDITGIPAVVGVTVNGTSTTNYTVRTINSNTYLFCNALVTGTAKTIKLSVSTNNAPVLSANTNVTIIEGSALVVTNHASDPDNNTLTFSLGTNAPAGMTIAANGVLSWTPGETTGGSSFPVTVVVTDNGVPPLSASNTFTVTVLETNSPPVLAAITNVSILAGQTLTITNTATDPDIPTNTLTFSLGTNAPAGMTITANGVLSWTPGGSAGGSNYPVTVIVTDNGVPNMSDSKTFTVTVMNPNTAPVLSGQTNRTVNELTVLTVTNTASDSDLPAQTLTYVLSNPPAGAQISTNGVITWTPSEAQGPSTNTITTVVTDNGLPPLSATNSFNVVVLEVNSAPVLPVQTNRTTAVLSQLTVTNTATDSDIPTNTLSYSLSSPPAGAQISTNGIITWTPTSGQAPGTNTITTVVTDNGVPPLSATNSFVVTVQNVNHAPVLSTNANASVVEGQTLTVTNSASDPDGNALVFTLAPSAPSGMGITTGGLLTWTPDATAGGLTFPVTVVVTDNGAPPLSASNTFSVTVLLTNYPPVLPSQPNQTIPELTTLVITNTASDPNIVTNGASGQSATNSVFFTYTNRASLVADGWSFLATRPFGGTRNTEITNGAVVSYAQASHAGTVRIPVDVGDLWQGANNTRNSLFRNLSTNWTSMQLLMSFAPTTNYQQAHLAFYQDDDNYIEAGFGFNGGMNVSLVGEANGTVNTFVSANLGATNIYLRLDHNISSGFINTLYSLDGTNYVVIGGSNQSFTNSQVAIWAGGSDSGFPNLDLQRLDIVTTNVVSGNSGNTLTYALVNPPAGATIDTNGVITWTPSEAQGPSTNLIKTVVTNNGAPPASSTNSFNVVVNEINTAPVLPVQANQTLIGSATLTLTNTATDTDIPVNALSYALVVGPGNAAISTNGIITWSPTPAQIPSTNTFTTVVTDTNPSAVNALHLSATNTFIVFAYSSAVHNGPSLLAQTNRSVNELTLLTVTNTANYADIPALTLSYSLVNPPAGAAISTNGIITWTPSEAQGPSTNLFTTVVTDNGSPALNATNSFTVVVNEVNTAPTLPVQLNQTVVGQVTLTVTNTATDTDIPVNGLGYVLTTGPTNATISTNGIIIWTPTPAQLPSTNIFTTVVTDTNLLALTAQHLSATNTFTVIASTQSQNGLSFPLQNNQTINELTLLTVTNTAINNLTNGGVAQLVTNSFPFTYPDRNALLADGWNFIATLPDGTSRNTEMTNGAVVSYDQTAHPGILRIPVDVGDLWAAANNTRNNLFRSLPPNWVSMVLQVSLVPTNDFQQVHLTMYQDDDNYIEAGYAHHGSLVVTLIRELAGVPANTIAAISNAPAIMFMRVDRDPSSGNITVFYSFDGAAWVTVATQSQSLVNPRLAVWVGGSDSGFPNADMRRLDLVVTNIGTPVLSYSLVNPPTGASIDTNGIITWTPTEAQGPSTNLITTVVTDNGFPAHSATNAFTVVVNEVNTAPVLPAQTNRTSVGLASVTVTNTATDTDLPANVLAYQLVAGPANASISASGVITWTPVAAQVPSTNVFTTVVTDNGAPALSATNSFTVTVTAVHNGPALAGQTNRSVNELTLLTVTNTASDSDVPALALNYTLISPPAGATISTNGVITWTPSEAQGPGSYALTTVVTDNGTPAFSATNSFNVTVNEVNSAPVLPVQTNRTSVGLASVTVTNTATDSDLPANVLTYQLVAGPANASISANGVISWTPIVSQVPSTNVFTTVVTDNGVPALSATNSFTVTVTAVHNGPALAAQTNHSVNELTLLTVTNTASDSDVPALALNYTLISPPAGATISTNGVITWTPSEAQGPGSYALTTVVTDSGTPALSATNSFTVVVNEVNSAPVLPGQTNRTSVGLASVTVTNTATDSDLPANILAYQLVAGPANASISASGVITWTPIVSQVPSTNVFMTVVTDNGIPALSATNSFTVTVTAVHNGPSLAVQTNQVVNELTLLTVTNTASDSDLPALSLSYSLVNPPAGALIDTNGVITWTPSEAQGPGSYALTTVVTDSGTPALSATNSFNVTVNEVNSAPVLPVQTNRTSVGLASVTVTNTATDSDLPANILAYQLVAGPANASISASGIITWTPVVSQVPSTNVFTTVVTDNGAPALSATNSFTVTVTAVHNGPSLAVQTNQVVNELTLLTVTNTASDSDLPALSLTYSLVNPPAGALIDTNGVITWTPSEAQGPGSYALTTVVTDNGTPALSATNSFTVVVNEVNSAPVLPGQTNRTSVGLASVTVTNTATDSDLPANILAYQLVAGPANASISASGIITWTPVVSQVPSTNVFTTVVTDNGVPALSATNSFIVTVSAVHNGPALAAQTNRSVNELTLLTVTNSASDSDIPALNLTYSLVAPPAGAVIDTNGVITWTPSEAQGPGSYALTTVVTDNGTPALSATNSFNVTVNEVNTAPVLPAQTNRTSVGLASVTVTNTATDSDLPANLLAYQLVAGPANASISASGVITWTPVAAQVPSMNVFTTVVTDNGVPALSATNSFTVTVTAVHNGPSLAVQTNQVVNELTLLTVTNTASDSDVPALALNYTLISPPAGATISTNGVITWTPSEAQGPGSYALTTVVTDNGTPALSATNSFNVTVNEVNSAPVLPVQTNRTSVGLASVTVTNTATDSDLPANVLTYQLVAAPGNATISTNGIITWTPVVAQVPSTNVFTTVVTDNGVPALSATNSFIVVVKPLRNGPILGSQTNRTVTPLTSLEIANTATDNDIPTPTLTYSLMNPPPGATIDNNGLITWTPTEGESSSTNLFVTVVTDNGLPALSATNSFCVIVKAPPVPPVIQSIVASGNIVTITWTSVTNQIYRLQYKTDITATDWTDLGPDVTATAATARTTDTIGASSRRFYRVVLLP